MTKHLTVMLLRVFGYPIVFLGVFTSVALIGIPILCAGAAILDAADKIEIEGE